jgi:LysM repeat protein
MKNLISVITERGSGIYFTSKTESLKDVENKFNVPSRLVAIENGLTSLNVEKRALYLKSYSKTYVIKPTDTIKNLQEKFSVSIETIYKINKTNYLYPGQMIILEDE